MINFEPRKNTTRLSLHSSLRWSTRAVLALTTAALLTTACNKIEGASDKTQPGSVSLVAEPAATRPVPSVEPLSIPCDLGVKPLTTTMPDLQTPKERQESINQIAPFLKANVLGGSLCKENIAQSPGLLKYIYRRFDGTEVEVEDTTQRSMIFEKANSKFEYNVSVTSKDGKILYSYAHIGSKEAMDNLNQHQLAGQPDHKYFEYASEEAGVVFPADTKWQRINDDVENTPGQPRREALFGSSDSAKSIVFIDDRGFIAIYTAP